MQANSTYAIRCGNYAIGNGVTFGEAYALLVYSLKTWVQNRIQLARLQVSLLLQRK